MSLLKPVPIYKMQNGDTFEEIIHVEAQHGMFIAKVMRKTKTLIVTKGFRFNAQSGVESGTHPSMIYKRARIISREDFLLGKIEMTENHIEAEQMRLAKLQKDMDVINSRIKELKLKQDLYKQQQDKYNK